MRTLNSNSIFIKTAKIFSTSLWKIASLNETTSGGGGGCVEDANKMSE
jgi:hypothetical protein